MFPTREVGILLVILGILCLWISRLSKKKAQTLFVNNRVEQTRSSIAYRPFRINKLAEVVFKGNVSANFGSPLIYLIDSFPSLGMVLDESDTVKIFTLKEHVDFEEKIELHEGDYLLVFKNISRATFSLTVFYKEQPYSRLYDFGLVLLEIGTTVYLAGMLL